MQKICLDQGVNYTDAFSMELPCADDIPKLPENRNHYLAGYKNQFNGTVGFNVYLGSFLPQVCK